MAGEAGKGGTADWRESLPEELRAEPMFKDIPDVATLAKVARDSKGALGASIRVPGPEAAPELRKEFLERLQKAAPELVLVPEDEKARAEVEGSIFARLGRPKEAKEYSAPKDVELPPAALEALRAEAVEEGLTKKQFEARAKRAALILDKAAQGQKELTAALKKELGAAYDERTAAAATAAERLGFPGSLVQAVRAGAVDVGTFKALDQVAKGFGQRPNIAGQDGGDEGKLTPAEARSRAAEIRGRKEYWDQSINPGLTESLRRKHSEYMAMAHPKEA